MNETESKEPTRGTVMAAGLWTDPSTEKHEMDVEVATLAAKKFDALLNQLEMAWVVIANVGVHKDGWPGQHEDWVKSAEKWRDDYHKEVLGVA